MDNHLNIREACFNCRTKKYIYDVDLPADKYEAYKAKQLDVIANLADDATETDLDRALQIEYGKFFGKIDYTDIKRHYNDLILNIVDDVQRSIDNESEPLLKAIKYAYIGNYIDFAALDNVNEDTLKELINKADDINFSYDNYLALKQELNSRSNLVYLCDNCGEIVFDKLVIKKIKELYPHIKITAVVRGYDAMNDATMDDVKQIHLDEVCEVIDNGTDYMGTFLNKISKKCSDVVLAADIIISKGQGNAESLIGCGLNIYYMFLCKCDYFASRYNAKKLDPILSKEVKSF